MRAHYTALNFANDTLRDDASRRLEVSGRIESPICGDIHGHRRIMYEVLKVVIGDRYRVCNSPNASSRQVPCAVWIAIGRNNITHLGAVENAGPHRSGGKHTTWEDHTNREKQQVPRKEDRVGCDHLPSGPLFDRDTRMNCAIVTPSLGAIQPFSGSRWPAVNCAASRRSQEARQARTQRSNPTRTVTSNLACWLRPAAAL
jgi:hypothetical protein